MSQAVPVRGQASQLLSKGTLTTFACYSFALPHAGTRRIEMLQNGSSPCSKWRNLSIWMKQLRANKLARPKTKFVYSLVSSHPFTNHFRLSLGNSMFPCPKSQFAHCKTLKWIIRATRDPIYAVPKSKQNWSTSFQNNDLSNIQSIKPSND